MTRPESLYSSGVRIVYSLFKTAYRDLTVEVLSSFNFNKATADFAKEDLFKFCTFGQCHSMSFDAVLSYHQLI